MNARTALDGLAHGLELALQSVRALASETDHADDWVDQAKSPLGRRRHCRLVRDGKLPGFKVEGHVFVKRKDLNQFIEQHPVEPKAPEGEGEISKEEIAQAVRSARDKSIPRRGRRT